MEKFKGVFTALITPFKDNEFDTTSFEKLIQQQLAGGAEGFVVNGTTAESPTLSSEEVKKAFDMTRAIVGSEFPIVVGTGSNSTQATIEKTKEAERLGADGVLVVTPYYNKPTQAGMLAHFKAIAESTGLPIILYNVPGRCIVSLEAETVAELSKVRNIVAIKEASGDLELAKKIKKLSSSDFVLLSGDDGTCLDFIDVGGEGVISVMSHVVPAQLRSWVDQCRAEGINPKIREDFSKLNEFLDLLYCEPNPGPVKMALFKMGIIQTAEMRLPLLKMTPLKSKDLETCLENNKLI